MRWSCLSGWCLHPLPMWLIAVGLAVLVSACDASTQQHSNALGSTSTPEHEDATPSRSEPHYQSIVDALALWSAGRQQQAISAVQALAERYASLRVYQLSEPQYAALAYSTQIETLQNMLDVSNALSRLGHGMVAAGREAREAGDMARARRMLSVALKLGQDNMGPPEQIVVLGDKTGKRIADAAGAELVLLP